MRRACSWRCSAFAELAAAEPEAMTLALLGAFGAGPRALERRNRTLQALEQMIQAGRSRAWTERPADLTVKFLIGGIREVSATRLRGGPRARSCPSWPTNSEPGRTPTPALPLGPGGPAPRAAAHGRGPLQSASERGRRAPRAACRAGATTCRAIRSSKASANGSSTRPRRSSPRRASPASRSPRSPRARTSRTRPSTRCTRPSTTPSWARRRSACTRRCASPSRPTRRTRTSGPRASRRACARWWTTSAQSRPTRT